MCSGEEAPLLRKATGDDFVLVTPGIRLTGERTDDQSRIVTPVEAIRRGANYLVIGRPITQAPDPGAMLESIDESLNAGATA